MSMREKTGSPVGVGALTVLTVLLVLSLAVFAALTFTTARSDLALSRTNADTVSAYYAADTEAARMAEAFARSGEGELVAELPVNEAQRLRIHLAREADGSVSVLEWKTVPAGEAEEDQGSSLPVFDGALPEGAEG